MAARRRGRDHALPSRPLGRPRPVGLGRDVPCRRRLHRRAARALGARRAARGCSSGSASDRLQDMFDRVFTVREYAAEEPFRAAGIEVTPVRLPHYRLQTYGFRLAANGRRSPTRATAGRASALAELARDADLFVCEATLLNGEDDGLPAATSASRRRLPRQPPRERAASSSPIVRPSCPCRKGSSSPTTVWSSSCSVPPSRRDELSPPGAAAGGRRRGAGRQQDDREEEADRHEHPPGGQPFVALHVLQRCLHRGRCSSSTSAAETRWAPTIDEPSVRRDARPATSSAYDQSRCIRRLRPPGTATGIARLATACAPPAHAGHIVRGTQTLLSGETERGMDRPLRASSGWLRR